jgi:hypothetical protein
MALILEEFIKIYSSKDGLDVNVVTRKNGSGTISIKHQSAEKIKEVITKLNEKGAAEHYFKWTDHEFDDLKLM